MTHRWRAAFGGDVVGGITAALLTVPMSMGFGALAVHGLGERYIAYGMAAALSSAVVVPIVAVLLGSRSVIAYAPRSVVASLIGSLVVPGLVRAEPGLVDLNDVRTALSLLFAVLLLAGAFQGVFGALRLGGLVRYIPSPVMAGFQNAAALLIVVAQIPALLGLRGKASLLDVASWIGTAQPLSLAVGLLTAVAMWQARRITTRVPGVVVGLGAGTTAYYLVAAAGYREAVGPTMGAISVGASSTVWVPDLAALTTAFDRPGTVFLLVAAAFSLALVSSLDMLLCVRTVEAVTGQRTPSNAELLRLGLGNTVTAGLGGITSSVSLAGTFAAYRAGARTSVSTVTNALGVLLAVLAFAPVLGYLPRAVIAGMLLLIGIQLFDVWTVQVAQRVLTRQLVDRRRMTLDLAVTLLVATLAITVGLVVAVATGVAVAILFFLLKMSKNVVRRAYHADMVHSRKTRPPPLMEALQTHGRQILVLELEGPIFFGTAENLARRVDAVRAEVAFVILDLKRVNEVDTTGGRLLVQIHRRLASEGKELLLAHVVPHEPVGKVLQDVGVVAAVTPGRIFADTDRALESAEDRLLSRILALPAAEDEFSLEHLDVLAELGKAERDVLQGCLSRRSHRRGEVVFREGDPGRELFIIVRGTASVRIRLAGDHREKRLATFSAGTIFGEMALLDAGPRSATVIADDDLVCYVLTEDAFATLVRDHHVVAIRLLASLGRELGRRLRRANQTIYQLEA